MSNEVMFLAPLRLEALALRIGAPHHLIERIGMGPVRAAKACRSLSAKTFADRPIVLAGVAGALAKDMAPGEVVVASSLLSMSGGNAIALPGADELGTVLKEKGYVVHIGPIVSSPSIVRGDAARGDAAKTGAVAVDMEALWCSPLARSHPFFVVRVILDVAGQDVWSWRTPRAFLVAFQALSRIARIVSNEAFSFLPSVPLREIGES
jgi:4-hydroxy-3-methylbut-2-enyl diphosphate reductase